MKRTLYIMRGLPGSGKSTWVKEFVPEAAVCSADYYHTVNGVYTFVPENAAAAHRKCFAECLVRLSGVPAGPVVVDNTNVSSAEFMPYVRIAETYGYDVVVVQMPFDSPAVLAGRNVHGVGEETIRGMEARWEGTPAYLTNRVYAGTPGGPDGSAEQRPVPDTPLTFLHEGRSKVAEQYFTLDYSPPVGSRIAGVGQWYVDQNSWSRDVELESTAGGPRVRVTYVVEFKLCSAEVRRAYQR